MLVLCLVVAGCGTNLGKLLRDDTRLYWQADHVLQVAEPLGLGLEDAAYEAEAAQHRACRGIYAGLVEAAFGERHSSFFDRLWSSLKRLFAALVPIDSVEGCAKAQEAYRRQIQILCRKLEKMGTPTDCPG